MTEINETIDTILRRRSIRTYVHGQQIPDEALRQILRCGLHAPNGGGSQLVRFIVIQDPLIMETLNGLIREELAGRDMIPGASINRGIARAQRPNYHFIHHAPTLINAAAPRDHDNSMADCSCALMNMQIAAESLGIACSWSNQPHWLTDVPALREIWERVGLREDEDIFGSISLGIASLRPTARAPRKPGRVCLDTEKDWSL